MQAESTKLPSRTIKDVGRVKLPDSSSQDSPVAYYHSNLESSIQMFLFF